MKVALTTNLYNGFLQTGCPAWGRHPGNVRTRVITIGLAHWHPLFIYFKILRSLFEVIVGRGYSQEVLCNTKQCNVKDSNRNGYEGGKMQC